MGLLGNLFGGGKVDVEGSLALLNRPADTFFLLAAYFFPCDARSGPLAAGVPDDALLARAVQAVGERSTSSRIGDIGERFTARLAPGHYQVCVTALPLALETSPETGQPKVVADPNNRFAFWPLPQATEVRAGQKRMMSLKLNFPKGLGRFGERQGPVGPLLDRIGEENRAAYVGAGELARRGDLSGAMHAYGEALASKCVAALLPADANELRLVLKLGQYKCLADAGRPDEALALLRDIVGTLLPRVRLSEADPATAWDMMSTLAIAGARQLLAPMVIDSLPAALSVLAAPLAGGNHNVEPMLRHTLSACLSPFARAQNWAAAYEIAEASLKALAPIGRHPLTAIPAAYQLEGYLASGTPAQQHLVGEIAPEGRAVLLRVAQDEGLLRLAKALEPLGTPTSRA